MYYMLMKDKAEYEEMWKGAVERTIAFEDIIPLYYYRAYKYAFVYLKNKYPSVDLLPLQDRFFYAE